MGEPRYNGAYTPQEDDDYDPMAEVPSGGLFSVLFPKVKPSKAAAGGEDEELEVERIDFTAAGRHNGAFQLSIDPISETIVDRTAGMHPVTRFIAGLMQDPVAEEKKYRAFFEYKLKEVEDYRLMRAQPMKPMDTGYVQRFRPIVEGKQDAPASNSSWKMRILHMETQQAS